MSISELSLKEVNVLGSDCKIEIACSSNCAWCMVYLLFSSFSRYRIMRVSRRTRSLFLSCKVSYFSIAFFASNTLRAS